MNQMLLSLLSYMVVCMGKWILRIDWGSPACNRIGQALTPYKECEVDTWFHAQNAQVHRVSTHYYFLEFKNQDHMIEFALRWM